MSEMLVSVTEGDGTGVEASIPGYRVAGKTATAQKIDPETGHYTDTHYVASFVGFVPADKPRLVVVVMIDEPMAGTYAGGSVAAPVFRRVGEMALRYLGVPPDGAEVPKKLDAVASAKKTDPAEGAYQVVREVKGDASSPDAAAPLAKQRAPKSGEVATPDLSGYPARDAIKELVDAGLFPKIEGSGRVLRQEPSAGSVVVRGTTVTLTLEPPS
jgi:cell division protein FtsI (penicillin-binding protein 3)